MLQRFCKNAVLHFSCTGMCSRFSWSSVNFLLLVENVHVHTRLPRKGELTDPPQYPCSCVKVTGGGVSWRPQEPSLSLQALPTRGPL